MNELALFAGAGGGILGGKLLGWRTVCAVEWEPYPASVLCARQNEKILAPFPIWDDVRTFDGKPWRGIVDVVSGGFPCQDISAAGHGAGISGSRSGLWSEMARIIGEVRPRYAFVENSPMLTSRGLGTVLGDLAALGFDARWGVISAADVGAPHLRERIWIVGHANVHGIPASNDKQVIQRKPNRTPENIQQSTRSNISKISNGNGYSQSTGAINAEQACESDMADADQQHRRGESQQPHNNYGETVLHEFSGGGGDVSHTNCTGGKEQRGGVANGTQHKTTERRSGWPPEPNVGRVAHGVAARVDRLKAIGNGQVPAVAALAWEMLTA